MKIYIAGPMTGLPDCNRPAFFKAEKILKKSGHTVLNPANNPEGLTHDEYMHICRAMIDVSEMVVFLPGWEESKGARIEYSWAIESGKRIEVPDEAV